MEHWRFDRNCVLCGKLTKVSNSAAKANSLRKNPYARASQTALPDWFKGDLTYGDLVHYLGSLLAHGPQGVTSWAPKQYLDTLDEIDKKNVCSECSGILKFAYLKIRPVVDKLHPDGAIMSNYLGGQIQAPPAPVPLETVATIDHDYITAPKVKMSTMPPPLCTTPSFHAVDRVSQPIKKDKCVGTSDLKVKSKKPGAELCAEILELRLKVSRGQGNEEEKKKLENLYNTIYKLVKYDMRSLMKNDELSCLQKYHDEDGFIPLEKDVAEELEKKCPLVKRVLEGLFIQSLTDPQWTPHMTSALYVITYSNNKYVFKGLQKTIYLTLARITAPIDMYNHLHKLGLCTAYCSHQRFIAKNLIDSANLQLDVGKNFEQETQEAQAPEKQKLVIGRNLPRKRLWPVKNKPLAQMEMEVRNCKSYSKKPKLAKPKPKVQKQAEDNNLRQQLFKSRIESHLKKMKSKKKKQFDNANSKFKLKNQTLVEKSDERIDTNSKKSTSIISDINQIEEKPPDELFDI